MFSVIVYNTCFNVFCVFCSSSLSLSIWVFWPSPRSTLTTNRSQVDRLDLTNLRSIWSTWRGSLKCSSCFRHLWSNILNGLTDRASLQNEAGLLPDNMLLYGSRLEIPTIGKENFGGIYAGANWCLCVNCQYCQCHNLRAVRFPV